MNIRAETESRFLLKYLIIGIGCFLFFLWGAYDALIGYPAKMPRAQAWEELIQDESLNDAARTDKWESISEQNGWKLKRPTKKETVASIEHSILFNYGVMFIGIVIAIPCIGWYLMNRNSWIESTDDGLRNSAGQELALGQIVRIDKKKWEKKGIAVISYKDDSGTEKKFIVDDLKYKRKPTDEIIDWVESNVDRDLIVNGITEAELRSQSEAVAADTETDASETS